MKILVVNAFGLGKNNNIFSAKPTRRRHRQEHEFGIFLQLVASALKMVDVVIGYTQPIPPQCYITSALDLQGLLCAAGADNDVVLDEAARAACERFDTFDIVFIGSSGASRNMLPWDANLVQLSTLMHMCNMCGKPCFTVGCAAHLEVCTLALQGRRIHLLNGARGSSLAKLPLFPVFARFPCHPRRTSPPPSPYSSPCCFLDNETGDLYSYVEAEKQWVPTGNVGLRIVSLSGDPSNPHLAPPDRRYMPINEKLEEVPFDRDCVITVDVRFAAHPLLKNLSRQFVLTRLPEWHIQRYSKEMPYTVLGDSKAGPILFTHQLKTVLAADISSPNHYATLKQITSNHVLHVASLLFGGGGEPKMGKAPQKLSSILFGGGVPVPLLCHPPLAKQAISSMLPDGPHEVPPPPLSLFTNRPEASMEQMRQSWAGAGVGASSTDAGAAVDIMMMTEGGYLDKPREIMQLAVKVKNPTASRAADLRIAGVCRAANEEVPSASQQVMLVEPEVLTFSSPIRPAAPAPSKKKKPVPDISGWDRMQSQSQTQSQSQSARTSEQSWLPVRHPDTCRLTAPSQSDLIPKAFCSPVKKPFSSFRKYEKMAANDANRAESSLQTTHRDGEYLSSHEKTIKEYVIAKERFIHPEKRGFLFGGKASEMALREEGQVRPHGPYPENPRNQGFSHMRACDYEILRVEDRKKHIAGHWKKH